MRVAGKVEYLLPNLVPLGLWILEVFALYAKDGRTDRRTLIAAFPTSGSIIIF